VFIFVIIECFFFWKTGAKFGLFFELTKLLRPADGDKNIF